MHQQCVVHLVRASLRYTNRKDWQKITPALREIYTAPTVAAAEARFEEFAAEFGDRYPAVIRLWRTSWAQFVPFLDYDHEVRKVLYTTNIIESLNARFRQAARRRGHFPTEQTPLANWSRVAAGLTGFGSGGCCHGRQDSMGWSGGMSLRPRADRGVPVETARVARAAFPNATFCLRMRDVLGPLFTDEAFAGLFSGRGRPAESPGMLAIVSVLQFVEGLTDAQAADAVRGRVDWKYLLGLELTDQGFDSSVLSEFRGRLVDSGCVEALLFDSVLDRLKAVDLLTAGGRARTDSTHVLGAIRSLERLELRRVS